MTEEVLPLFQPISDKLICEPVEQDDVSSGGIALAEVSDQRTLMGRVLFVGPGFWAAPDLFVSTTIKPGNIIIYQRFSAQTFEHQGTEYQIVQERDAISRVNLPNKK